MSTRALLASPLGFLIGVSLGALGGGGSILAVPVLVFVAGQDPSAATTTSLVVVGVAALVAAHGHWRAGRVRVTQGLMFGFVRRQPRRRGRHHPHPDEMTGPARPERLVDIYADVSCPFAHLSLRRFSERRRQADADHVRLRVYAWPLELVNGEAFGAAKVTDEIADLRAQVADDLFAGFEPSSFPSSTIAILGTATLAYQHGADVGEAFNLAIRDALFEQSRAIGDPDVLVEIAAGFGIDVPDEATARAAVEANLAEGQRRGVTGSPYFIVDGSPFFCPTLDIERHGAHLRIDIDDTELNRFIDRALQ